MDEEQRELDQFLKGLGVELDESNEYDPFLIGLGIKNNNYNLEDELNESRRKNWISNNY